MTLRLNILHRLYEETPNLALRVPKGILHSIHNTSTECKIDTQFRDAAPRKKRVFRCRHIEPLPFGLEICNVSVLQCVASSVNCSLAMSLSVTFPIRGWVRT